MELHTAARSGDLRGLTRAIAEGADVNERDRLNRTPLHLAAWAGHAEVIKLLCDHHAAVNAAAADDMVALHFACQKGHLAAVKALLAAKAKVNVRTRKAMTPLHFAAVGGHAEIVGSLIRKGADTTATTKQDKTPMDLATDEGVREVILTGVSQKAAEAKAGAQEEDTKHKVDAEVLNVKKADAKEDLEAGGGESVDAQAETSSEVKHKQSEESTAEANVVAADSKAPAKSNKAGQSHLRKRRDELETEAGDPVQASEGPASKKKFKVNLSYFDTEGEET